MKSMLKSAFATLVSSLYARGITPTLNISLSMRTGDLIWKEAGAETNTVWELYSLGHKSTDAQRLTMHDRYTNWFDAAQTEHAPAVSPSRKPYSICLVRNAICKYDHEEPAKYRNRGRKVNFHMQINKFECAEKAERELSVMEELLAEKGWEDENDTCPLYDEGISCGFWVSPDEVDNFRADYKAAKAELLGRLMELAREEGDAETAAPIAEPDDMLPCDEDGTLEVGVKTYVTLKMSFPNEYAVVGKRVFVRALRNTTPTDHNFYITAGDRKGMPHAVERFLACPKLDADFIQCHEDAFEARPGRQITLMPREDYEPFASIDVYRGEVLGAIRRAEQAR